MKVNTKELLNALKLIKGNEIDVLFFSIKDNFLFITAKDHIQIIEIKISIFAQEEFEFCIQRNIILNLISKIPDDFVNIEHETDKIKINFESSNNDYTLVTVENDDFIKIEKEEEETLIEIFQNEFSKMIDKVLFAVSSEFFSNVTNNILLSIQNNKIEIVGTNGKRLSLISTSMGSDMKKDILIPYELAEMITKIKTEICIIKYHGKSLLFILDNIKVYLFENIISFPDYKQVIPKDFENEIIINRKNLIQILERLSLYAVTQKIDLNFKESFLCLSANNDCIGYGKEEISFVPNISVNKETGINYMYLLDCLKRIETDEIIIKFNSEKEPFYIVPNEEGTNYINLIMPLMSKE